MTPNQLPDQDTYTPVVERLERLETEIVANRDVYTVQAALRGVAAIVVIALIFYARAHDIALNHDEMDLLLWVLAWFFGTDAAIRAKALWTHNKH